MKWTTTLFVAVILLGVSLYWLFGGTERTRANGEGLEFGDVTAAEEGTPAARDRTTGPSLQSRRAQDEGEHTLRLRVRDPSRRPIPRAAVSGSGTTATLLGVTNLEGYLDLDSTWRSNRTLVIQAPGYMTKRLEPTPGAKVATVTMFPKCAVVLTVVDEQEAPLSGVSVSLVPSERAVNDGAVRRGGTTNVSGSVQLEALVPGDYSVRVSADSEGLVLSELLTTDGSRRRPELVVPCPPVTLRLRRLSVAWLQPEVGKIITGFFVMPFTPFDASARAVRDSLEAKLRTRRPRSLASALLSTPDAVFFSGYLERGGWTRVRVPVRRWSQALEPFLYENRSQEVVESAGVVVTALDWQGKQIEEPPFCLQLVAPKKYGRFTFQFRSGELLEVPPGKYALLGLQTGVGMLFTVPRGTLSLGGNAGRGPTRLQLKARMQLRRVRLRATRLMNGEAADFLGPATIESEKEGQVVTKCRFQGDQVKLWLPTNQQLVGRMIEVGEGGQKTSFEARFKVDPQSEDELSLDFVKH